jgi:hypothetical protein
MEHKYLWLIIGLNIRDAIMKRTGNTGKNHTVKAQANLVTGIKARIREPTIDNEKRPTCLTFVAFTSQDALDSCMQLHYGPANNDVALWLYLLDKPTAIEVYDLFNAMFKPKTFETQPLRYCKSTPDKKLNAYWRLHKEDFGALLNNVKDELGEEWFKVFSRVHELMGQEYKFAKGQTIFKISGKGYKLSPKG